MILMLLMNMLMNMKTKMLMARTVATILTVDLSPMQLQWIPPRTVDPVNDDDPPLDGSASMMVIKRTSMMYRMLAADDKSCWINSNLFQQPAYSPHVFLKNLINNVFDLSLIFEIQEMDIIHRISIGYYPLCVLKVSKRSLQALVRNSAESLTRTQCKATSKAKRILEMILPDGQIWVMFQDYCQVRMSEIWLLFVL